MDTIRKRRSILLTIWLIIIIIANLFNAITYFVYSTTLAQGLGVSLSVIYLYAIFSVINIILAIFLFSWQKWAFWIYLLVSLAIIIVNLFVGFGIFAVIFGILSPFILYLIMEPQWRYFK